jgi:hypothetical protein
MFVPAHDLGVKAFGLSALRKVLLLGFFVGDFCVCVVLVFELRACPLLGRHSTT